MAKKMTRAALFFMIGTVILTAFYKKATYGPALSLAITFGTVSYHLVMRLLVGGAFQAVMQNRADLYCSATRFLRNSDRIIEKK